LTLLAPAKDDTDSNGCTNDCQGHQIRLLGKQRLDARGVARTTGALAAGPARTSRPAGAGAGGLGRAGLRSGAARAGAGGAAAVLAALAVVAAGALIGGTAPPTLGVEGLATGTAGALAVGTAGANLAAGAGAGRLGRTGSLGGTARAGTVGAAASISALAVIAAGALVASAALPATTSADAATRTGLEAAGLDGRLDGVKGNDGRGAGNVSGAGRKRDCGVDSGAETLEGGRYGVDAAAARHAADADGYRGFV